MTICPECGAIMVLQQERYDLTVPYVDKWMECLECEYCIDANYSVPYEEDDYED